MSLRRRLLDFLRARLRDEALPVRLAFWDGEAFEFAPAPAVTITLRSKRVLRLFLSGDMGRLGEAYARGEIDVDGQLQDILRLGIHIAERVGRSRLLRRIGRATRRFTGRSARSSATCCARPGRRSRPKTLRCA